MQNSIVVSNGIEAELQKLSDDLSGRVPLETAAEIVDIFRAFIKNGYEGSEPFPVLERGKSELQHLEWGCVMASLFFEERERAKSRISKEMAPTEDVSLRQCQTLFLFSRDLAFYFRTQMDMIKNDGKASSAKKRLN